jgi:serine/threonine protein kinase
MSEVYLARATGIEGFEKLAVVKRILPEFASEPKYIDMFLDEARLAATLHHQNIAQIFDIGEDRGQYFFAQEYVRGHDLQEVFRSVSKGEGEIGTGVAVAVISAAASGLHYAHEKRDSGGQPCRIVHCDVSPSNVLVSYEGGVKLIDFGIARAAANRGKASDGAIKGKASYLAPEQADGGPIDRRADIFSLGILLYETTTQSRLFVGENWAAVLEQVRECAIPPPSSRRPGFPRGLESILRRALAKDPDRRYQTAQDLAVELDQFASEARLVTSSFGVANWLRDLFGEPEPTDVNIRGFDRVRSHTGIEWAAASEDDGLLVTIATEVPILAPTSRSQSQSHARSQSQSHSQSHSLHASPALEPEVVPRRRGLLSTPWFIVGGMTISAVLGGLLTLSALRDDPAAQPAAEAEQANGAEGSPTAPAQVPGSPAAPSAELPPAAAGNGSAATHTIRVEADPVPAESLDEPVARSRDRGARSGSDSKPASEGSDRSRDRARSGRARPTPVAEPVRSKPKRVTPTPSPRRPDPPKPAEWSKDSPFLPE